MKITLFGDLINIETLIMFCFLLFVFFRRVLFCFNKESHLCAIGLHSFPFVKKKKIRNIQTFRGLKSFPGLYKKEKYIYIYIYIYILRLKVMLPKSYVDYIEMNCKTEIVFL